MTKDLDDMLKGMNLLPWKPIVLDGEQYLCKFSTIPVSYCFILYDLNAFYVEYLSSSEIECKFEELNPGLEMPLYRILAIVEKMFSHLEGNAEIQNSVKNGNKEISLKSEIIVAGISVGWQFRLTECDKKQLLKEQILQPLIGMIAELQQRQSFLISLIKTKDAEIKDYKEAGAKVSRRYLETSPFDECPFLEDRNCPELLSEIIRNSMKTTFNQVNEEFYVAIATAQKLIEEKEQRELAEAKNEKEQSKLAEHGEAKSDSNTTSSFEKSVKEKEIARRKELEKKLCAKPAKKKKKIAF